MIIRRYISTQVLATAAAVVLVLTVILMSGRVIKYFGMAADGRLDVHLLTAVLVYRLPGFLDLLVPLGLFIGILLTFGRLYLDNEMSVMSASGKRFIIDQQSDPVEFLSWLVNSLHLDLTGGKRKKRSGARSQGCSCLGVGAACGEHGTV